MISIPISALQHLLYCERQCALIHLEQVWAENFFTADGRVLHERAHDGAGESRPGVRIARGLDLKSREHGIHGQSDVVEFHADGRICPVEYKRGKPKAHRADEVQLCAQAICLEEMTGFSIERGFLYYGKTRRRTDVAFDDELRALTISSIVRLRRLFTEGRTPPPVFESKKCSACSLEELCLPRLGKRAGAEKWLEKNIFTADPPCDSI